MTEFKVGKCPLCGRLAEIIESNNPLSSGVCEKCLIEQIDPNNLKQVDFFCRTYNIPFDPNSWIELHKKVGDKVFKQYALQFYQTEHETLMWQGTTKDWWSELNDEWSKCLTFEQILAKVEPIKKHFIERCQIKWGCGEYSFEDYVQLENLLVSTLRANDISNPLQIDAIKKACKISIELDKAIEAGDSKGIKDLSSAYASFTKTAQIDEVIEAANKDVISTVADLADEIERCGGEFKYYDNVERDVVDKTIHDIQEYNRILVQDATGLGTTLEAIAQSYKDSLEKQKTDSATKEYSIEEIIKDHDATNSNFDKELESESLDDIDIGGDEDENF